MNESKGTATSVLERLDPVTLALVQNRLDHVARQMGWVMTRTARSPIFNHAHDFSCFITNADGVLLSQADGIPIHTGGGGFTIRAVLEAFRGRIEEGDVFLSNDPYAAGGNHLPDWVVARPVFVDGTLVAFTCNRAHQSDIGGGAAGTYNPLATEIFHEGIRLPPLKIADAGGVRDDLWSLLLLNTRCPEELDGDVRAMMGSTRIGAEHVSELAGRLELDEALDYFDGLLDHGERRMRQAIAALPDGEYVGMDGFDNDCFEPVDVEVRVTMVVDGDALVIDFTGTSGQIRGFKNSSLANTHSAVYAAVSSFFDADIPRNEGTFRPLRIIAPRGSLVNPEPPAPVTMCTVFPAYEIMHACWWALGRAAPERACAGWGKNSFPNSSGRRGEGGTWVMYHWGGLSGAGAVRGRDGFNQLGPLVTLGGLTIPNAEVYEQLYPVRVVRQEFRCDGGGVGQYRGGTGVDYVVEMRDDAEYSFRAEGVTRPTGLGVNGGGDGVQGILRVEPADGEAVTPPIYGLQRFSPATLTVRSPGGGGYGDPLDREPHRVERDVRDGVVSRQAAIEAYGVVINDDGGVDLAETVALRDRRRA